MTDGDDWAAIERLRDRLDDNPDVSTADADALRTFSERLELLASDYTDARHEKLLGHLVRLAENTGGLAASLDDKAAAEDLVRYINRTYDNEEYNRDHRLAIRAFGKHATDDGDPIPDSLDWVSSTYSNNYDPAPDPAEMLRWEQDIKPMLDACHNSRDKAYIALAWDLGARPSELHDLQVGNVSDHKYGLKVTIENGKTGTRSPLIVPAVPFVNRWLADHPGRNDPNAPLWSKLGSVDAISDRMERKLLREAADRAGVTRPVTRRNFRKSSASYLASQNLNQTYIEDHHGWVRGSKVAARYVAVFGEESDHEIAKAHGKEVDDADTADPVGPVECTRCGRDTPRDEPTCMWCGQVIDHASAEQITREQTEVRSQLLSLVQGNPELLEQVDELERLLDLADDDPEVVLDMVEAMDAAH
jgi:integrase